MSILNSYQIGEPPASSALKDLPIPCDLNNVGDHSHLTSEAKYLSRQLQAVCDTVDIVLEKHNNKKLVPKADHQNILSSPPHCYL